jgi:hypothetical protein
MIPLLVVYVLVVAVSFTAGGVVCVTLDRRRDWPDPDGAAEWDEAGDVTEAMAAVPADWDVAAEPEPLAGRVLATMPPNHRPRPEPYPDEMDQLFCDECLTLCQPGGPCMCCWDGVPGSGRREWDDDTDHLASTGEMWLFRTYLDADDARDRLCSAERASAALAESRRILAGA